MRGLWPWALVGGIGSKPLKCRGHSSNDLIEGRMSEGEAGNQNAGADNEFHAGTPSEERSCGGA